MSTLWPTNPENAAIKPLERNSESSASACSATATIRRPLLYRERPPEVKPQDSRHAPDGHGRQRSLPRQVGQKHRVHQQCTLVFGSVGTDVSNALVRAALSAFPQAHGPHVEADAVLVVSGVREDGYRQHLGLWAGDTESEQTWSEVFAELKERGLDGVHYVVSDDHRGLRTAIDRYFQGALWQRCHVHFVRNVLGKVRRKDRPWVAARLKDITEAPGLVEARAALARAVEELSERYPEVAGMLEEQGEQMLTVYALPPEHRKRMCSTNMLERWLEEVRRRTRVVRIFPNRASCVRLIGAHCLETNEEWLERRYLRMEPERVEEELAGWEARAESDSACCSLRSPTLAAR